MWEEEEAELRRQQRRQGRPFDDSDPPGADGGDEFGAGPDPDPADFLERLSRVMGGPGGLSAYQSGRLDPFGTSSSDAWFRRVEQQRASPFGSRPGGDWGRGLGGERPRNLEWEPYRPGGDEHDFDGWRRPGQRPEWGRDAFDDDERDGRGGGGGGSRPLKGDDFRRGGGGAGFRGW